MIDSYCLLVYCYDIEMQQYRTKCCGREMHYMHNIGISCTFLRRALVLSSKTAT